MQKQYRRSIEFHTSKATARLVEHYSHILHISQDELINRILALLNGREVDVISVLRQEHLLR